MTDQSNRAEFMRVMEFLDRLEFWVVDKRHDDPAFHGGHTQEWLADHYAESTRAVDEEEAP